MKKEELVHIKLEHEESVNVKRDILNAEADLLRVIRSIRKYKKLRLDELNLRLKFYIKLKLLKKEASRLQYVLPKIKIPDILKREKIEEPEAPKKIIDKKEIPRKGREEFTLEEELRSIQEKLKVLH